MKRSKLIEDRLKAIRKKSKLNQRNFAKKLSTSYGTLQTYEQGKVKVPHPFLEILIKIFKININWLLTGQGEMFINDNEIKIENNNSSNEAIEDFKILEKKNQKAIHLEILKKLSEEGKI